MIKYIILLVVFCSCYSQRKAQQQFDKAALAYPIIPANYCSKEFPVKEITKRDTLFHFDTTRVAGTQTIDTVIDKDTVRITSVKILPGQTITKTIQITDTIYQENTASLKVCEINRDNALLIALANDKRANEYKAKAHKRGAVMWSLIGLVVLTIAANIYLKVKKL